MPMMPHMIIPYPFVSSEVETCLLPSLDFARDERERPTSTLGLFRSAIVARNFAAQPGIFACRPRATASASAFTRSEEHTSELQSLMRISYAVFCLKNKTTIHTN